MDDKQREIFSMLMYFLTKEAARYDFSEFLDELDISYEDYELIRDYLSENYGVKTYV